jgi:hypothetical protein
MNEFFENLYEYATLNDYRRIEIRGIVFGQGVRCNEWLDHTRVDSICREVDNLHYYFGCATRRPNEGNKANVVECPFLWTEIDFKETNKQQALKNIAECPFPPTYVILSGGGFHLYWKLKEPFYIEERNPRKQINIKEWESYLRRLCYAMDGDSQCTDITRILRVPMTHNYKYDHKPIVRVGKFNDIEHNLEDIVQLLPPESDIPRKRSNTPVDWNTDSFMEKAYAGKPYGNPDRNAIVKEVVKYYSNHFSVSRDVYFHVMKFVNECVEQGQIQGANGLEGGAYDEVDVKRRCQWGIENRQVYDIIDIEKETDKAFLVKMWLPKSQVKATGRIDD